MRNRIRNSRPSVALLEAELIRIDSRKEARLRLQRFFCLLTALLSAVSLAVTLWFPILQVHGNSMFPTLKNGDILLCVKTGDVTYGDVTLFYQNNKILVKRLIGMGGDRIDLNGDGQVSRNGSLLSENYTTSAALGVTDIPLPCQVPENSFFLMGDHRETSLDSRSSSIGCIPEDRILGKVLLRIWPLNRIRFFDAKTPDG